MLVFVSCVCMHAFTVTDLVEAARFAQPSLTHWQARVSTLKDERDSACYRMVEELRETAALISMAR